MTLPKPTMFCNYCQRHKGAHLFVRNRSRQCTDCCEQIAKSLARSA